MRFDTRTGLALLAAAVSACSASSPSASTPASLSALERALVLKQVLVAAASGFVGTPGKRSGDVPLGNLSCEKSCSGGSCTLTCPIDEQFACPAGGTASDRGRIAGVLDATLTGEATLDAVQGFSGCKPNASLTIDGAPGTTATGTARFVDDSSPTSRPSASPARFATPAPTRAAPARST